MGMEICHHVKNQYDTRMVYRTRLWLEKSAMARRHLSGKMTPCLLNSSFRRATDGDSLSLTKTSSSVISPVVVSTTERWRAGSLSVVLLSRASLYALATTVASDKNSMGLEKLCKTSNIIRSEHMLLYVPQMLILLSQLSELGHKIQAKCSIFKFWVFRAKQSNFKADGMRS